MHKVLELAARSEPSVCSARFLTLQLFRFCRIPYCQKVGALACRSSLDGSRSPLQHIELMYLCVLLGIRCCLLFLQLYKFLGSFRKVQAKSEAGQSGATWYH
jgi:hypothetical protein